VDEPDFNPFVDETDDIEDAVVSQLDSFVERAADPQYAPTVKTFTDQDAAEELPPVEEYDFEREIARIEAEIRSYSMEAESSGDMSPLPLPTVDAVETAVEEDDPFSDLLDLLPNFDDEESTPTENRPEEDLAPPVDWGFLDANSANSANLDEDDWGFDNSPSLHEDLSPLEPSASPGDEWELDEDASFDFPPESGDSDDFVPPDDPFATVPSTGDNEPSSSSDEDIAVPADAPSTNNGGLRQKLQDLKRQILSELRGGQEIPEQNTAPNDPQDNSPGQDATSSSSNLLGKILFPYTFIANFIFNGLVSLLGILEGIPLIGLPFKFILKAKIVLKILSYVLPLIVILAILHWHGGTKFKSEYGEVTFPDNGSAKITAISFNPSNNEATVTIENTGDVIAEVTPTLTVQGLKPSANPLSFFYPKEVGSCTGSTVSVPIGKTKDFIVKCDDFHASKEKVSGELKW